MRIAYLDCFSGISGDMFLGALVDAGVSPKLLEDTVAALDIGARLEISRVVRGGISATKVDVYADGEKDLPREVFWEQQNRDHAHEAHDTIAAPTSIITIPRDRHHRHEHARGLTEIRKIIEKAAISSTAKSNRDSKSSRRWARPKPRFTIRPSSESTFTKSAPSMPWLILSAPQWERNLLRSKNGYARR